MCGSEQPGWGMCLCPGTWRWVEKDQPGQKGMAKWRELFTLGLEICLRLLASDHPVGDKGPVFALSPEPTPPPGSADLRGVIPGQETVEWESHSPALHCPRLLWCF